MTYQEAETWCDTCGVHRVEPGHPVCPSCMGAT